MIGSFGRIEYAGSQVTAAPTFDRDVRSFREMLRVKERDGRIGLCPEPADVMVKTTQVSSPFAFIVLDAAPPPSPGDSVSCDKSAGVELETRRSGIAVSVSITVFSTQTLPRRVKSSGRITVAMLLIDAARSSAAELGPISTIRSARHRPPVLRNAYEPEAMTPATRAY
jgi:hypothetical protein